MKKTIYVVVVLFAFASIAYGAGITATGGSSGVSTPTAGKAPRTTQVTVDNTARTLDNLVVTGSGTYLGGSDNTLTPIAATISCETADTQWAFTTTPTAALGHVLTSGSSWQPSGSDALALLRGRNSADGASATCAVTLWY